MLPTNRDTPLTYYKCQIPVLFCHFFEALLNSNAAVLCNHLWGGWGDQVHGDLVYKGGWNWAKPDYRKCAHSLQNIKSQHVC